MNYTEQQAAAIYSHDRNLIVVAGAGSGKTRVLVERYLALLEQNPDWSLNTLVAITFTKKAAQEMRDRVRSALQNRLRESQTSVAQARWATLLAQMDSARIDTIHALCATILRANAAEANIDPRFNIIEPIDAQTLLQDTIARVLNQLLQGETPDPLLTLFRHYDAAAIHDVLMRTANEPLFPIPETPEDILAAWGEQWEHNAAHVLATESKSSLVTDALTWATTEMPFPKGDKLAAQWDDAYAALQLIQAYAGGSVGGCLDSLSFLVNGIKLNVGGYKAWGSKDDLAAAKHQLGILRNWAQSIVPIIGTPPGEADEAAAALLPLWVGLVKRVQSSYAAMKAADDLLDFSDLERRTADLLTSNPTVQARYLGTEFNHVLVDEFQDTNERQWAIISALTAPEKLPAETARLFIVGDPKQSIYGFRGADVSVFERVRRLLHDATASDVTTEIALSHSFRTHQPLIGGFNHIFEQLLIKAPGKDFEVAYGMPMTAQREQPPTNAPAIEITLIDVYERAPDGSDYVRDDKGKPSEKISAQAARTWEAFEIATRIRQLVEEEKRPVFDRETGEIRPVTYADIALLFQATSHFGIYEDALRSQNIDYTTVAGRGYYSRQEVWDVLALLEALYNPYDDLALATALRSPLFNLSDEALFALRLRGDDATRYHLWDELRCVATDAEGNGCGGFNVHLPEDERENVLSTWRILYELHTLAGRVTISELLREVLAQTNYLATLSGLPEGARLRANVEKLLKKAVASGRVTLSAFTEYLSDLSVREVREGEGDTEIRNAVTIMTVHSSKGLEFPIVFLPDASWARTNQNEGVLLNHPDLGVVCATIDEQGKRQKPFLYHQIMRHQQQFGDAERKRLLYVAATRAQDALLVSGQVQWDAATARWKSKGLWMTWLLEALALTEHVHADEAVSYDWGEVRVRHPMHKLAATTQTRIVDESPPLWEHRRVAKGEPLSDEVIQPPLTAPVIVEKQRFARNLTATQIADVGSATYHPFYSERFRRSVTQDAPAQVKQVITGTKDKPGVPARVLGEIVHEALRWWRFPDRENDMEAQLTSYAWKHGVVQPDDLSFAVNTARGWLRDMRYTDIYRWINKSERVYRELPFVYQTDKRVIHGIIDVLFQRPDGTWAIVDYKSSLVQGYLERNDDAAERENRRLLAKHAERYHLQVGIYAAAVERYLATHDEPLEPNQMAIFIHYLRYGQAVLVRHEQWTAALTKLETQIGRLIEETDPL